MAVDFNKYTNYLNTANVCNVIFGANSPVLEVELNEIQEIQQEFFNNLTKFVGVKDVCVIKGDITVSNSTLIIQPNTIILVQGEVFIFKNQYTINLGNYSSPCNIYFSYKKVLVEPNVAFNRDGIANNSNKVSNWSIDSRYGILTTKRYVKEVKISTSSQSGYSNYILGVCYNEDDSDTGNESFVSKNMNTLYSKERVSNYNINGVDFYNENYVGVKISRSKLYDLGIFRDGETKRNFNPDEVQFEFYINGLYIPVFVSKIKDTVSGSETYHNIGLPDATDYQEGDLIIENYYSETPTPEGYINKLYKKENNEWSIVSVNPYTAIDTITVKVSRTVPWNDWDIGFKNRKSNVL